MKKKSPGVVVHVGQFEFLKINTGRREWRDAYHWILSLSWPQFAALLSSAYIALNVFFASLYLIAGDTIAEMPAGSFSAAFFFSVQTLATVGYGHMYPTTIFGNILTTVEIMVGMFGLAVMTGLIFVRFSRPTARIEFTRNVVIAPFDGRPTLMLRVANLRHYSMAEAEFKVMFMRDEAVKEGDIIRRFYALKLQFDRIITFPVALTLRHVIDELSPLHGATTESLEASDARFVASVVGIETVIQAAVQSQKDYSWRDVRFGERFVEIYTETGEGRLTVDYGRLHETEPVPVSPS
ncbi:MAG: inward rectifier potassium channel [Verrucomicrobiota bacterium]|jgi:inward rectifier potassium channel